MKNKLMLIFLVGLLDLHSAQLRLSELTDVEAASIVRAHKESAKDIRGAALQSAEILETSVAGLGHKKVVFNRVAVVPESEQDWDVSDSESATTADLPDLLAAARESLIKPTVDLHLSGQVEENGISELLWDQDGARHQMFTRLTRANV